MPPAAGKPRLADSLYRSGGGSGVGGGRGSVRIDGQHVCAAAAYLPSAQAKADASVPDSHGKAHWYQTGPGDGPKVKQIVLMLKATAPTK